MVIPIQWRPKYIKDYEGLYGAVRAGFIYSFISWRFLKEGTTKQGYKRVQLWKNGKGKPHYVHRLVAQAFIENPNNLPEVNHINENKQNNTVQNLEFCDRKYNINYGTVREKISNSLKGKNNPKAKPILMFTLDGDFIRRFDCVGDANEYLGKPRGNANISFCATGIQNSAYNYKWIYEEDYIKHHKHKQVI